MFIATAASIEFSLQERHPFVGVNRAAPPTQTFGGTRVDWLLSKFRVDAKTEFKNCSLLVDLCDWYNGSWFMVVLRELDR